MTESDISIGVADHDRDSLVQDCRAVRGKVFGEQFVLELTYDSRGMRKIATDGGAAAKALGAELAEAFMSLVADIRNAMYLGELLEGPAIVQSDPLLLQYALAPGCVLEVQPVENNHAAPINWRAAHRVKLIRLIKDGVTVV